MPQQTHQLHMISKVEWKMEMESEAWPSHQHATMHNSPPMISKVEWKMRIVSSAWSPNLHATMHNLPPMISKVGWGVEMISWMWSPHQHATMHNSPTMVSKVGWRMEMKLWASSPYQHATMHNSPTMISRVGWRVQMKPWAWSHHQHATMHNSPSMISKVEWRVEIKSWAWSPHQHTTMHNSPTMISKSRMEWRWYHEYDHPTNTPHCITHWLWFPKQDGGGNRIMSMMTPPTCHNAQLTHYDFQSRMESADTYVEPWAWSPHQCTTMLNSPPIFPKQDGEWRSNHEHNDPPICHNAQLTSYDVQSRTESGDGIMSMTTLSTCHDVQLTSYDFQSGRMRIVSWV